MLISVCQVYNAGGEVGRGGEEEEPRCALARQTRRGNSQVLIVLNCEHGGSAQHLSQDFNGRLRESERSFLPQS